MPYHPAFLQHRLAWSCHHATVDTSCLAIAWHLKPPWWHTETHTHTHARHTPLYPSLYTLQASSSPSSLHHQANPNPSSRRWHSRLPLLAPGAVPTCQPPNTTEDEWITKNFEKSTDRSHLIWSALQLIVSNWYLRQLAVEEGSRGGYKSEEENESKDELLYSHACFWMSMLKLIQACILIHEL